MAIVRHIRHEYPFPQADSPDRIIEVAAIVHRGPLDDIGLAEIMQVTARQGRYYADAAGYLGLVRLSGGYWRPEAPGRDIANAPTKAAKEDLLARAIANKPVFDDAWRHFATTGCVPDAELLSRWVRREFPTLNEVTAARRVKTIASWTRHVAAMRDQELDLAAVDAPLMAGLALRA